jgi:hypothetical protein
MKLTMFALLGTTAGIATCLLVNQGAKLIAHHNAQQDHLREMMYAQVSPLEQGPGDVTKELPEGMLPLDATPTPGSAMEPGSMRPAIQLKPGAIPRPAGREAAAYLVLKKSDKTIKDTKDPIWELTLMSTEKIPLETLPSVTGRAYRQTANRNQSGTKAPLPKGTYRIDRMGIEAGPFDDPELGRGFWIPITPLFATGRSALGFHQDPSWGKRNGESGTSGCIGLQSAEDTMKLVTWIKHYNIQNLVVEN